MKKENVLPLIEMKSSSSSYPCCKTFCLWQGDIKVLKEQLRQKEEQLQANQQQLSLLAAELRDTSSTRDRTMSELYHMKLEADALRQAKAEAQAQSTQLKTLIEQMKAEAKQEAVRRLEKPPQNILFELPVYIYAEYMTDV